MPRDQVNAGWHEPGGSDRIADCVTANTSYPYEMKGSCMFGMAGSSSEGVQGSVVDLDNGTYYVSETKAPEGYGRSMIRW